MVSIVLFLLIVIFHLNSLIIHVNGISCQDPGGNDIQWSITYKLPKIRGGGNPNYRQGSGYVYILPGSTEWSQFQESIGINHPKSIIGQTLNPLYKSKNDSTIAYFLYNDEPPNAKTQSTNGHTKGILVTNGKTGFWLIHSVPKFPTLDTAEYSYPRTALHYGQIFLCLSLNVSQVDRIADIFNYTKPHVYQYFIPKSLQPALPKLSKFVKPKKFDATDPISNLFQLETGELEFFIFAKSPKFEKEIYADWIAPKLTSSLYVQSWLNGPNPLPSNCSVTSFSVYNILLHDLKQLDFSAHSDHSKWAIGTEELQPWACIGDLNRMEHQRVRGGAVLCTQSHLIWRLLNSAIKGIQPCPKIWKRGNIVMSSN